MKAAIGRILGVLSLILLSASAVRAQTGTVSLLVGYAAGGSADFVARIMASELSTQLGPNRDRRERRGCQRHDRTAEAGQRAG